MSPAEHYAKAEHCLELVRNNQLDPGAAMTNHLLAMAQVHALLALAPKPPVIHVVDPR